VSKDPLTSVLSLEGKGRLRYRVLTGVASFEKIPLSSPFFKGGKRGI
jgi:hypothetical protein